MSLIETGKEMYFLSGQSEPCPDKRREVLLLAMSWRQEKDKDAASHVPAKTVLPLENPFSVAFLMRNFVSFTMGNSRNAV